MFNLTRLIGGYEGISSSKHLNQFIASIGVGATHHYDLPYGSANGMVRTFGIAVQSFLLGQEEPFIGCETPGALL